MYASTLSTRTAHSISTQINSDLKLKWMCQWVKKTDWLTVCPPEQPELEITLFPITEGSMFTKETAKTMIELIKKGTFGPGVFTCKDIFATYEELKSKGVEFMKAPTKEFYGTEALFKDDSGNWFSLSQLV